MTLSAAGALTTTGAATFGGAVDSKGQMIIRRTISPNEQLRLASEDGIVSITAYNGVSTDRVAIHFVQDTTGTDYTPMIIDASGNLGLGVTPSAWGGTQKSLQLPGNSVFAGGNDVGTIVGNNMYWDGSAYKYIATAAANMLQFSAGSYLFRQALSGTAGNPITFTTAMTLDASGNVGIGTSSPTAPLTVNGGTASAATIQLGNHNDNASIHGKYSLSFKADSTEAIADRSISFAIGTAANFALTTSTAIFNDLGADIDFRVESDGNANMLFVDGGSNRVGIGRVPQDNGSTLQVAADATASTDLQLTLRGLSNENKKLVLGFDTTANIASITSLEAGVDYRPLHLQGSEFVWNEVGSNHDFRVESDTNANMLFVDAGSDTVCIGTSTASGDIANTSPLTAGRFRTLAGVQSAATATATTLVTLPAGFATYIVNAGLSGVNDAGAYGATAIVHTDGSTNSITQLVNPAGMTISMSGMAVQGTQTSGSTLNISFSILRM
jgi:hypothetical protein